MACCLFTGKRPPHFARTMTKPLPPMHHDMVAVPRCRSGQKVLLPLLLCTLLASCAVTGPLNHPDDRKLTLAIPAAWSQAGPSPSAPDDGHLALWWQQLADPLLDQIMAQTLAGSPDLKSARAKLRQARASRDLVAAGAAPDIKASASAQRYRNGLATGADGASHSLFNAGLDAAWEPDIFGSVAYGVAGAQADVAAQSASLAATRVSLVAEVALNYVDLRTYQSRLAIARSNADSQADTLQIVTWRAQAGLASRLDVAQASTNLELTRAGIPSLEAGLAGAEHRLAILAGLPPASLHPQLAQVQPLPSVPEPMAEAIPADTLRRRPDVTAAEQSFIAETARVRQKQAARLPSFSLSGNFSWQAASLGAVGHGANLLRSLSAGVALPLFDGGRIRSAIDIQDAVQEQALVAYEKAVLTALEDVENALVAYAQGRQRLRARQAAASSAAQAASLARNLYQAGLADFQKVLDTERTRLSAEDSLASAQAEQLTAVIQLYKSLGGGWPADSAQAALTKDAP